MIDINKKITTVEDIPVRMITFIAGNHPFIMVGFIGCGYTPHSWDNDGNHYLGHASKKISNKELVNN